jgi:hypothetical protein
MLKRSHESCVKVVHKCSLKSKPRLQLPISDNIDVGLEDTWTEAIIVQFGVNLLPWYSLGGAENFTKTLRCHSQSSRRNLNLGNPEERTGVYPLDSDVLPDPRRCARSDIAAKFGSKGRRNINVNLYYVVLLCYFNLKLYFCNVWQFRTSSADQSTLSPLKHNGNYIYHLL